MRETQHLILVEDDTDDQDLLLLVLKEMKLDIKVKMFSNGIDALKYLVNSTEQPFLILSDINMPLMDGITLKKHIDENETLRKRCIPFVFLSTSPAPFIKQLCILNVQGYFEKGNSFTKLTETVRTILNYWNMTKHLASGK
jgi:CheY-like chemotaxis protein